MEISSQPKKKSTQTEIILSTWNGSLIQIDFLHKKLVKSYGRITNQQIWCIKVTQDKRFLFVFCADGSLQQWNLKSHKLLKDYGCLIDIPTMESKYHASHGNYSTAMCITPDDKYLYIAPGKDGTIVKFNLKRQSVLVVIPKTKTAIFYMAVSRDNRFFFTSTCDGWITQWTTKDDQIVKTYNHDINLKMIMVIYMSHNN